MNAEARPQARARPLGKFEDPNWTARGEPRAQVALERLNTLWLNTGTLCNITCANCYIESSPSNDRLVYLTASEAIAFFDEITEHDLRTSEIGITGGEPFLNPDILTIMDEALSRGFNVLLLTNAMQPMQRPRIKQGLLALAARFSQQLTIRVSLDHYSKALHEEERGPGTWDKTLAGLDWLSANNIPIAIAGRTCWNESGPDERAGYARLIAERGWSIHPQDLSQLVLLPEMDGSTDVPEISTGCWDVLPTSPSEMMCATSRMVIKRKGAARPSVVPCTLIPYDAAFDMGTTLKEAANASDGMFADGSVKLCHPHCARFCALGGGNCSGG